MWSRPLGSTGLTVSPIGLGTVKLGRTEGLKYPAPFHLPSDQEAVALLTAARDLGVTLIDTAPAYGVSEERLGRLLPLVAPRDRWLICTKAGESFERGVSTFEFSAASVTASVHRSLKRLRTDRLDIVLLHSDGDDAAVIDRSGGLEALRALQSQGLIRAVGVSTKSLAGALRAVECCDVIMVTLNRDHTAELPAIQAANSKGVGVLVKKALRSGHTPDPAGDIRFALETPGVSSVVIGTSREANLRSNLAAARSLG